MAKLKSEQKQLTEELRELMKTRRKESDLKELKSKCDGLDARMKYAEKDRKEAVLIEMVFLSIETSYKMSLFRISISLVCSIKTLIFNSRISH
jgi:hypothetical protein